MILLTRRRALLLPLLLTACGGGGEAPVFAPLRYDYLPPIPLNVATIEVQQRFIPAGVPPDVSGRDPVPPADALRAMAIDRIKAFGTSGRAVFAILDASLTRQGDVIHGAMAVSLTVFAADDTQGGFAEARVQRTRTGSIDNIRAALYELTTTMMDDMNVEFEFQVRHNLRDWLASTTAPDTPVQQAPLDQPASQQGVSPQQVLPTPQGLPAEQAVPLQPDLPPQDGQ